MMHRLMWLCLLVSAALLLACSARDKNANEGKCTPQACNTQCLVQTGLGGSCVAQECQCLSSVPDTTDDLISDQYLPPDSNDGDQQTDVQLPDEQHDESDEQNDLPDVDVQEVPPTPECSVESVLTDCSAGQGCVDGACAACQTAQHCASGYACTDSGCGPCTSPLQCLPDQGCHNGICGPCVKASDCQLGLACIAGQCQTCTDAEGCFGHVCMDQACTPCDSALQCHGQYGLDYTCDQGQCVRETCLTDADCTANSRVCDPLTYQCVFCTTTARCLESPAYGAGYQCLLGQCSSGDCEHSEECPPDMPICGSDHECRGCMASAQGAHAECNQVAGSHRVCLPQGACVPGNCVTTKECDAQGGGLCQLEPDQPDTIYFCRSCVGPEEDDDCRTQYGLDDLICEQGACVAGCNPGLACGDGLVCGADRRCTWCLSTDSCATAFSSGHICVAGVCVQGDCQQQSDCAGQGELCIEHACSACSAAEQPDAACTAAFGDQDEPWICEVDTCIPGNCHSSMDCLSANSGQVCANWTCTSCQQLGETVSQRDAQCALAYGANSICTGTVCEQGCAPGTLEAVPGRMCGSDKRWRACESDSECALGSGEADTICNFATGLCTAGCQPGAACAGELVCGADHRCGGCTVNAGCASAYSSDFLCIEGTCQAAECNSEKACTLGRVCDEWMFFCRDCESHDECGTGKVCDLATYGGTGRCRVGECTKAVQEEVCTSNLCLNYVCASCDDQHPCGPTWQGDARVCEAATCVVGECTAATQDDDCFTNLCLENQCADCTNLLQCGPGRVCDTSNHWCFAGNCIVKDHCGLYPNTKVGQVCDTVTKTCRSCAGTSQALADQDCTLQGYPNGTICVDGMCQQGCTDNDHCPSGLCLAGHCQACSADSQCGFARSCNEASGVCVEGTCAVDSDCPTPTMPCKQATCALVGTAYTCQESALANGTPCNDGQFCTLTDTCQSGVCAGSGSPCDDGLACTQDNCSGAACGNHDINPGTCKINGLCYLEGTLNPTNPCQECRSTIDPVAWTSDDANLCTQFDSLSCKASKCVAGTCTMVNDPNQEPCADDGNPCTLDYCNGGICTHPHVANNTPCDSDSIDCTTDTCQNGVCVHAPQDTFCNQAPDWTFEACLPAQGGCTDVGWARAFTVPDVITANWHVAVAPNGSLFLSGHFSGSMDFDPGPGADVRTAIGGQDGFVAKFSDQGDYQWVKTFGRAGSKVWVAGITAPSPNQVLLAGSFYSDMDFDPGPGVALVSNLQGWNVFLLGLTATGEYEWARGFGDVPDHTTGDAQLGSIVTNGDNIYLIGDFAGSMDLDPGPSVSLSDWGYTHNGFVVKYNLSGDYLWGRAFHQASVWKAAALAEGGVLAGGKLGSGVPQVDLEPSIPGYELSCPSGCAYILKLGADSILIGAYPLDNSISEVTAMGNGLGGQLLFATAPNGNQGWSSRVWSFGDAPSPAWTETGSSCDVRGIHAISPATLAIVERCSDGFYLQRIDSEGSQNGEVVTLGATSHPGGINCASPGTGKLYCAVMAMQQLDIDFTDNISSVAGPGYLGALQQFENYR